MEKHTQLTPAVHVVIYQGIEVGVFVIGKPLNKECLEYSFPHGKSSKSIVVPLEHFDSAISCQGQLFDFPLLLLFKFLILSSL